VSSGLGSHNFSGVLYGEYEVTVTLVGFDPDPKRVTIKSDEVTKLDLQLNLRGRTQNIAVKGGRTNQANTLVNSASVTAPFTGQAALSLPAGCGTVSARALESVLRRVWSLRQRRGGREHAQGRR